MLQFRQFVQIATIVAAALLISGCPALQPQPPTFTAGPIVITRADSAAITDLLSAKEFEVFRLLAQGLAVAEIATALNLSQKTVANHQTQIKEKLALENLTALVHLAQRHQLIDPVV